METEERVEARRMGGKKIDGRNREGGEGAQGVDAESYTYITEYR